MRIFHRYLGFFLAGIMAVYALSGIVLIFRDTDFLKNERIVTKELSPNLSAEELGKSLRMRDFKIDKEEGEIVYFKTGTYNKSTGVAEYKTKQLPLIVDKMTKLHKANTGQPLFFLNIFFGLALLFFVISSFWMFIPSSNIFKKGLYFSLGGLIFALLLMFL
jgi:uncharacterized iron-regulated membrane protein